MSTNQPFDTSNDLNDTGAGVVADFDGDGVQETAILDFDGDGTLDTLWVDLDGDLVPDMIASLPTGGPFDVADPGFETFGPGMDACDPESVFDPGFGPETGYPETGVNEAPGITFLDPFTSHDAHSYDDGVPAFDDTYMEPTDVYTPDYSNAYMEPGTEAAFDTTPFTDASWDAWNVSNDYDTASWDAWSVGDYETSQTMTDISGDWADYSQSMDYLQYDPTDSYSWDAAYDAASSAEWDNWNASVDAYVAGDYEAAYDYNSASIDAASAADATWDASSSYSSYDSGSFDSEY